MVALETAKNSPLQTRINFLGECSFVPKLSRRTSS